MTHLKKKFLAVALSLFLPLGVTACDTNDDPDQTNPGDTETTQPVGS